MLLKLPRPDIFLKWPPSVRHSSKALVFSEPIFDWLDTYAVRYFIEFLYYTFSSVAYRRKCKNESWNAIFKIHKFTTFSDIWKYSFARKSNHQIGCKNAPEIHCFLCTETFLKLTTELWKNEFLKRALLVLFTASVWNLQGNWDSIHVITERENKKGTQARRMKAFLCMIAWFFFLSLCGWT